MVFKSGSIMRPAGEWKSIALGVGMILLMMDMGCFAWGARISGSISEKQVQGINHGQTTRQQILDWFGEPNAVARQDGGFLHKPVGPHVNSEEFSSEVFFKLFSETHRTGPQYIIYYYQHVPGGTATGVWLNPIEGEVVIEKLWVLIDQETGNVEDHVFRKESKKVQHDVLENP